MVNKFRIFELPMAYFRHQGSTTLAKAFFKYNYKSFLSVLKIRSLNRVEITEKDSDRTIKRKTNPSMVRLRTRKYLSRFRGKAYKKQKDKIIDKIVFMRTRLRFFYFYILCRSLAVKDINISESGRSLTPADLLKRWVVSLFSLARNNFIFNYVSMGIYFVLNYLCFTFDRKFLDHCYLSFLIISNDHVTAKFISRYIARKLHQGFTIRSLMNPLLKEFRRLCGFGSHSNGRIRSIFETFAKRTATTSYFSSLFRTLMSKLHKIYKSEIYGYVEKNKTPLSFDVFLFSRYAYKSLGKDKKAIISLCRKYVDCYFFFMLINYYNTFLWYRLLLDKLLYITEPLIYFNAQRFFLHFLPKIVYSMCAVSYEAYLNWSSEIPYYYKKYLLSSFLLLFNKKMHSTYGKYYKAYMNYSAHKKYRLLRNPDISSSANRLFKGFKIQFLGRFTRRQRSAKLTWLHGKVPLTNVSSLIEYADYNIILINSLVNVKVWFNKTIHFIPYYLKLI